MVTRQELQSELLAVWTKVSEHESVLLDAGVTSTEFADFSGATKDLLLRLGMTWDYGTNTYVFED